MLYRGLEKPALIFGETSLSYSQLGSKISQYSNLFSDIQPGSRVSIFAENRPEWVYAFYAILLNKCVAVPVDFMSSVDELAFITNDCRPELIFCSATTSKVLKEALTGVHYEPRVIQLDDLELYDTSEFKFPDIAYKPSDTALIIYTSGTTGSPKGVMLSYDNLLANIEAVSQEVPIYQPTDRLLILLPLHHIFPLLGSLLIPLNLGASAAIAPSLKADDILKTLQKNKITIIIGVPRLYNLFRKGIVDKINQKKIAVLLFKLANKLKSPKFSKFIFKEVHQKFGGHVKCLVSGGAALDPQTAIDFRALGFDVLEGFGMTEAAPMITFTRPGTMKPGAAGQPVPGVKIEIRDGEVVATGRNVMQGYYNRPDETAAILKDGWLYTGDLGYLDKDEFLFITGRKKEIIVLSNGKNINPVEIEQKIDSLSSYVKESGVFVFEEKLSVLVVPNFEALQSAGITDFEAAIRHSVINRYNDKASPSKKLLKLFVVSEDLPKTRLGKLQRFKLEQIAHHMNAGKTITKEETTSGFKELTTLMSFLKEQLGSEVYADDNLADDLALDSLAKITLIVYVESTFGVAIPEDKLYEYNTIRDLAEFIRQKKTKLHHELINWNAILKEKIHFTLPKTGFSFNLFNWTYRLLIKTFFRIKTDGTGNIPEGPCIIAPNHQSFLDAFVVASAMKRATMRKTYFYAKEKYWKPWFLKIIAKKNNIILMDINKDLKLSIQKMAEVLKLGKNLIIFPEGTRSKDGSLGEYKKTFAILAQELNVPVIPVVIEGADRAFPVGSILPRFFRKVQVKFLTPVNPQNHSYDSLQNKVQNLVADQLKR